MRWRLGDRLVALAYNSISVESPLGKSLQALRRRWISPPPPANSVRRTLDALCTDCSPVIFVQVGSNDGITSDPLREFIVRGDFRGVLVEPVPYLFERLRQTYREVPGISLENVAVAVESGERDFYYLRPSDNPSLPLWYDKLGSFNREVILRNLDVIPSIPELLVSIRVPCRTLQQICERQSIARPDLIHIDAEGYDFEIIKSIDFSRIGPIVLLYEHKHLGITGRLECRAYLSEQGYDTLEVGDDTLCMRRGLSHTNASKTFREMRRARWSPKIQNG
jgi:FkbM family methyltransferase